MPRQPRTGNLLKQIAPAALISGGVILAPSTASAAGIGELGVLDTSGINPATGLEWAPNDTYRLMFVSSTFTTATSTDITTYNTFVQNTAIAAGLGDAAWYAVGSTATVNAKNNTNTNPTTDGSGEAILQMDGSTIIADDYADLWDGINVTLVAAPGNPATGDPASDHARGIVFDENGTNVGPQGSTPDDRIFTGTNGDGTASGQPLGTIGNTSTGSLGSGFPAQFWGWNSGESTRWTQDFSFDSTQLQQMYGISETLTVQVVPEPTSLALLGMGGMLIARRRRG